MLKFSYKQALPFISEEEIDLMATQVALAHKELEDKTGPGNDFLGWMNLPVDYDKSEFERIKLAAKKIQNNADYLVIVGIGGSYLGARAVIEALSNPFDAMKGASESKYPQPIFVGHNLSATYLDQLCTFLKGKRFAINVISKSGTTMEPAIAFRVLKDLLEKEVGVDKAKDLIFATTDKARGALKSLADTMGYETFVVPDDIGGRFSVLSAVGLLPIASCGFDIDALMQGAAEAREAYASEDLRKNDAYLYAAIRLILYRRGYAIELLENYEPSFLHYVTEWWKQLYGESEGKMGRGIFPAGVDFTADLHSMGQYIQEGRRHLFETVIWLENAKQDHEIPFSEANADGLNYLAGKGLHEVNHNAMMGTALAHVDGQVPNLLISLESLDEKHLGMLMYFFERACGLSGYLNAVNSFNQPGVEAYKKNMFALLGKPGFEVQAKALRERLDA